MTAAARALLESVRGAPEFSERLQSFSMEDKLLLPADSPWRQQWQYWPTPRSGLSFDLMHAKHRALTHELLWQLLSNRGYHKLVNVMQLENVLQATSSTGFPRGIEDYSVTLFGEPSDTVPWAWRFEGHHISLSISVVPVASSTGGSSIMPSPSSSTPFAKKNRARSLSGSTWAALSRSWRVNSPLVSNAFLGTST